MKGEGRRSTKRQKPMGTSPGKYPDKKRQKAETLEERWQHIVGFPQASKDREERTSASPDRLLLELAAHDLRNPLSGVLTAIQFLIEDAGGVLNADQLVLLRSIESSAQLMLRLVEDMAELPQLATSTLNFEWHSTDLGLLLEHIVAVNRPLAENRRITIDLRMERPQATVRADPVKLSRALESLLTSTIRSSQAGGKIELQLTFEGDDVIITLQHEDPGHSSDILRGLFDPSLASRPKRKFMQERAALTLAYARRVLEAHQGTVRLGTDPTGKSSVVIRVPVSGPVKLRGRRKPKRRNEGQNSAAP
jgi:signal transduction histidine kinase